MNIGAVVLLFLVLLLGLALAMRISLFMARRAVCKVIAIFHKHNAVQPGNALTLGDLGLAPRSMFTLVRDYKPWAFQTLFQAGIIRSPLDGWYYLSEEDLQSAKGIQCPIPGRSLPNPIR